MRILYIILAVLTLAACATSPTTAPVSENATQPPLPTIDPANTFMVTAQKNYDTYCAHCHGKTGGGQPTGGGPGSVEHTLEIGYKAVPRHDQEGHTWQHPDQLLFETIKYGVDSPLNLYVMSGNDERLSDDEIWGLIDYIKRFWTNEQRNHQVQLTKQFRESQPNWEKYHLDIYTDE